MDKKSTIFWFSGTGNSLYAAKCIAAELGDTRLARITDKTPSDAVGGKDTKVGFVFPSYYWNLPRAVWAFVEKLEIKPDTYIFAVVTMGGTGHGSIAAMKKLLKAKGLRLHYGKGVKMPANYVLLYNPADSTASEALLDQKDNQLREIAAAIASETRATTALPIRFGRMYKNIEQLDAKFTVGDACTGCGLCERLCSVGNIKLDNGKPV